MNRNAMLKILNPILGILLVNQILTGVFHAKLPHEAFEIMHEISGFVLTAAVALHVILNWNWIKTNFFRSN